MNVRWKLVILSIIITLLLTNLPQKVQASVSVSARNAILMEQESGRTLFEKNAHEKRRIASITKIMTAILAVESGKLGEMVQVTDRAEGTEGSSLYLKRNEKIKLEDLVYGLMLRSGNDAAIAIAEHVGGSVEGFVFLMNQKAEEIGMKNSNFDNPHGLDDSNTHYSTAYDMALLTRYAMENSTYREISGTEVHRAPNPEEKWERVWRNKNRLVTGMYEHSTGGKTGYTKLAKRTLVSTASKEDLNLIAVTLNAPDDWNDHIGMFEMGFHNFEMVDVVDEGDLKGIKDAFYKNKVYLKHVYRYPITTQEREQFHLDIKLLKPKGEWKDGGNVPEVVGNLVILFDDRPIKELSIYYKNVEEKEPSFLEKFKNLFTTFIGVKNNG